MSKSDSDTNDPTMAKCSRYLKAAADPIRLQIIRALQNGPLTVSDISLVLEMELVNISHHLRVLFNANMVTTERDGKFIYYSLNQNLSTGRSSKQLLDFGCCKLDMRSTSNFGGNSKS